MPRNDWYDDNNTMSRDRTDRDEGRYRGKRDEGGFFGSSRDSERGWGENRGHDRNREHSRSGDRDRHFGSDDYNRGVPMDETKQLIASNKVEGTPVYDRHGDKLGTIHNFMVDKRKGHVVYAVLKHGGGFLGFSERYYPLEWDQLTYDTHLDGYHVRMTEDDLKSFGSFDSDGRWHRRDTRGSGDRDYGRRDSW